MSKKNKEVLKTLWWRFLKGGLASAIATMAVIQFTGDDWTDFSFFLNKLALAGAIGFVSGGLLAIDKSRRLK